MSITLADARVVTPAGVHDGWITIEDGRITHVGRGQAPRGDGHGLGGRYVVPGFVDIHTHGGAGGSFPSGDQEEARRVAGFHAAHGTTTIVASLVTAAPPDLARATAALAELCDDGVLAGIHFEGPYIARSRCGAHDPALLRDPSPRELAELLKAGHGHVRMVTIAPELPGGLDTVRAAVSEGVIAALGHSDASYEQAIAGIEAGCTVATHLFNALPSLHHREPGPVAALLEDERVTVELINDGLHVHPAMLRLAARAAGTGRAVLITDAMAAAGMGDGAYRLGSMEVEVSGGAARLVEGGAIAGSTLTMDLAFRRTVQEVGLTVAEAAVLASLTPARVLGVDDRVGSIAVGKDADLVVLDDDLTVHRVMRHGAWLSTT
ncbi:N-acetylglucosamine-6-phosphate deacetylase [Sphaerisporangium melleum]|uniref:N-acetylglucosamine-6-phosphate deacetylase n=1 Tax=Sphaerisporangium melleum TaxID=321316 RepID=A0A917QZM6_9ACTN|nr:N-acetylglucosamine-6-phosphate deacetylase [Sphaerisporangium melleum]GGK77471.1 N-acetylglucosamine-6-phosphate deacetylase [Sphaerisporangium melleum]GII71860.1 N-acetylglucosamine-6-phosphate deacetylase [Sphaerisporangium melleum]